MEQTIGDWLRSIGLVQYAPLFEANGIDLDVLPDLSDHDLEGLGLLLGHRRKLQRAIAELRTAAAMPTGATGERRQLTVMFCELIDAASLATRLDPEDLHALFRRFSAACDAVTARYDGFVAQFLGETALIYFGYPVAHEDDAERAIRAALDLTAETSGLATPASGTLAAHCGVATGLVVVGEAGTYGANSAVGETPNLAARLLSMAPAGEVLVAGSTRRLVGEVFQLRDRGLHALKGLPEPVHVWSATGLSASESRFESGRTRQRLTGFVGRAEEAAALDAKRAVAWNGQGQVVLISGEPGIGKSRFVARYTEGHADRLYTRLRWQCSPYHTASPLFPIIEQLKRAAAIEPTDATAVQLDKLERMVALATSDVAHTTALFASLLSIPFGDRYPPLALGATEQRRQTLAALREQLEGLARQKPVLLVFEDIHWADASTLEVLDLLVQALVHLPVLAIITYRPEFTPSWVDQPNVTALSLGRLEAEQARAIIEFTAGERQLPADVVDHILAKTDGIPLFIEELTQTVLESGLRDSEGRDDDYLSLAIPATLQDSLMARLDRLSPVREIAQISAAIGREFSYALLQAVAERDAPMLDDALAQLEAAGLLVRIGTAPDARYQFKHALIQDAAYASMLRTRRATLHRRIAEALRDQFTFIADAEPESVARHFTQAALTDPAVEWWTKAAVAAQQRSAYVEASAHYEQAIRLAATLPAEPAHRQRRLKLQLAYGQTLIPLRGYAALETAAAFAKARELAAEIEDPRERMSVTYGLWVSSHVRGELAPAREAAASFLRDAEREPNAPDIGIAHRAVGMNHALAGELAEARHHIEQALAMCDPTQDVALRARFGLSPSVTTRIHLALVLWQLGDESRACRLAADGLDLAARSLHVPTTAFGYGISCILDALRRDSARVRVNAEALVALSLEHNLHSSWLPDGVFFRDWARWWRGDRDAGTRGMHETINYFRRQGLLMYLTLYRELLAETEQDAGNLDVADAVVDEAFADIAQTGLRWFESELYRRRAEIALSRDRSNVASALADLHRARAIAQQQHAASLESRAALGLAALQPGGGVRGRPNRPIQPYVSPQGNLI